MTRWRAVNGLRDAVAVVTGTGSGIGPTKAAALEYGGEGVRVNAIRPGVIRAPMVDRSTEDDPEMIESVGAATSANRTDEPEGVDDAAVRLRSDDASFVTGEAMVIDGGSVA